ncbi:alpha/beta hydrolase [Kordiimonas sp. SCSIO 12603]|uniref:alpha/beta fold hydrolase n=1 Tax=Kordiimonas sp. SCSIO 12603 TaxID=2829596 RepID=UPI002103BD3C|nr:alpha/beta hydrolase [Kordiimonas sp. SCSIO 12603]UTW58129.1 alpha/beta hydrolase [Kordiimonas sp. SCSIO 12603]
MVDFTNPEFVETNGVTLPVYRAGPDFSETDKPAIVFLHGFPEIAYSWRAQLEYFSEAGYPVIAPDQRGYGRSSKPQGKENYTMKHLSGDLAGLLDHYGIEKAIFVGHDWGAIVLWQLPFYIGERVMGCAGLNVPLLRHFPIDPITIFRERLGEQMYIVRFQEEGACEPILEKDLRETFKFFLRKPGNGKSSGKTSFAFEVESLDLISLLQAGEDAWGGELLMPEEELEYYVEAYTESGFTGPLHWYRNMAENWEAQKQFLVGGQLPKVEKPCLMITAEMDRACPPNLADGMEDLCKPYTRHDLKGCGHWSQQERSEEVNTAIHRWIREYF